MKTALILLASILVLFSESRSQWTQTNLYSKSIRILLANDSFLFAGTTNGIFRSEDNGNHWQKISPTSKDTSIFPMVVMGNNVITPFYSSTNNGTEWERHPILNFAPTGNLVVKDSILYIGRDSSVYYSNNKGLTWKKAGSSLPGGNTCYTLTINGSTLYAGGAADVFKSSDNGATWGRLGHTLSYLGEGPILQLYSVDSTVFAAYGYGLYYNNPSDSLWKSMDSMVGKVRGIIQKDSVLFVGIDGYELIYRSSDNGKKWNSIRLEHTNKLSVVAGMVRKGNTVFVATDAGRLFYSSDEGNTWEESKNIGLRSNTSVRELVSCGGTLFATSDAGISTSSDNGLTWISTEIIQAPIALYSNGSSVYALIRSMDSIGRFGPRPYDSLIRTTDCGTTWTTLKTDFKMLGIKYLAECNSVLYAASENEVYKSSDSGLSWSKERNAGFSRIIAMTTEDTTIYILGDKWVNIGTKRGKAWETISHREDGTYTFPLFSIVVKDKRIFLGSEGVYCIDTIRNGYGYRKIVKINDGKTVKRFNRFIVSGSNIFVASDDQIYKSTDDGKSWTIIDSLLPKYQINTFTAHGSSLYIARGTTGVWKYENILDVNSNENLEPMPDSHILCYPNPTGNSLTIDPTGMSFNNAHSVHYILLNSIGEKVMEFEQNVQKCIVEFGELPNGVYSLTAIQGVRRSTVMVSVFR